jgi:hypothetical protein
MLWLCRYFERTRWPVGMNCVGENLRLTLSIRGVQFCQSKTSNHGYGIRTSRNVRGNTCPAGDAEFRLRVFIKKPAVGQSLIRSDLRWKAAG